MFLPLLLLLLLKLTLLILLYKGYVVTEHEGKLNMGQYYS
jgi:hypothetical protein